MYSTEAIDGRAGIKRFPMTISRVSSSSPGELQADKIELCTPHCPNCRTRSLERAGAGHEIPSAKTLLMEEAPFFALTLILAALRRAAKACRAAGQGPRPEKKRRKWNFLPAEVEGIFTQSARDLPSPVETKSVEQIVFLLASSPSSTTAPCWSATASVGRSRPDSKCARTTSSSREKSSYSTTNRGRVRRRTTKRRRKDFWITR